MVRSLIWKEWREHRWKMGGIFGAYLLIALVARFLLLGKNNADLAEGGCLALAYLVPGFVAIGTVMEERTRKTLETLRGLPMALEWVFVHTWLWGLATALVPLLAVQWIVYHWMGETPFGSMPGLPPDFLHACIWSVAISTSLYAWTVLLAIRSDNEVRVSVIGVGVLLSGVLGWAIESQSMAMGPRLAWAALAPVGVWSMGGVPEGTLLWFLVLHGLVVAGMVGVTARYFAGIAVPARPADLRPMRRDYREWLYPQRRPILWKTAHEVGWMFFWYINGSLLLLLLDGVVALLTDILTGANATIRVGSVQVPAGLALLGLTSYLLAIAAGVEIGMADTQGKLDRFWPARPVNFQAYFWKRFGLGWAGTMVTVMLPIIVLVVFTGTYLLIQLPKGSQFMGILVRETQLQTAAGSVFGAAADYFRFLLPQVSVAFGVGLLLANLLRMRMAAQVVTVGLSVMQFGVLTTGWLSPMVYQTITRTWEWTWKFWALELLMTALLAWMAQSAYTGNWHERVGRALRGRARAASLARAVKD